MNTIENDLFVLVEYTGTLQNGTVFDTSRGRQPLEVQVGRGDLIAGFEKALIGMSLNEKKTFTLDPEDAYGHRDESLVRSFARTEIPPELDPHVGQFVALQTPEGQQRPARVVKVDAKRVDLDLNHPLAGETLTFDIEVLGISPTPTHITADGNCGCGCSVGHC